ncbi:MAG TPA: hypothetical protein VGD78_10960 [Chthoniobacterales bacterium]
MSLTRKLVLAFLLVNVVPLGVTIWVSHQTFAEHAEQQVGTRLEDGVVQVGKAIVEFMLSCMRGMRDLAEDPELVSEDRDGANIDLARYIHSFPYFSQVRFVNALGTVVASSQAGEIGSSLFARFDNVRDESRQAFHDAPGLVYISDFAVVSDALRRAAAPDRLKFIALGIEMLTTVQDASGHVVGVVVGDLIAEPMGTLLHDVKRQTRGDGSACLLDVQGRVLMSTDSKASLLFAHPDVTQGALQPALTDQASGYVVYGAPHGRKWMAAYTHLKDRGGNHAGNWRLITSAPYGAPSWSRSRGRLAE